MLQKFETIIKILRSYLIKLGIKKKLQKFETICKVLGAYLGLVVLSIILQILASLSLPFLLKYLSSFGVSGENTKILFLLIYCLILGIFLFMLPFLMSLVLYRLVNKTKEINWKILTTITLMVILPYLIFTGYYALSITLNMQSVESIVITENTENFYRVLILKKNFWLPLKFVAVLSLKVLRFVSWILNKPIKIDLFTLVCNKALLVWHAAIIRVKEIFKK